MRDRECAVCGVPLPKFIPADDLPYAVKVHPVWGPHCSEHGYGHRELCPGCATPKQTPPTSTERGPETDRDVCECRDPEEQAVRDDVFIWRGDPTWWSCMSCDQRVRPLTTEEQAERNSAASTRARGQSWPGSVLRFVKTKGARPLIGLDLGDARKPPDGGSMARSYKECTSDPNERPA